MQVEAVKEVAARRARRRVHAGSRLAERFARSMAALGPFEDKPVLAVAVSGGPDSVSLCLLADRWARASGGALEALIVDHGLRSESAAEARTVRRRLTGEGIAARVLRWREDKPSSGLQAAAREARYALLTDWCRRHGILHLLLGHQRDDQAETLLMRLERGSGPDGLAGMPRISERRGVRLLRPLLDVPRADLIDFLDELAWPYVEDPSNRDPRFARARLRLAMAEGDRVDRLDAAGLNDLSRRLGETRATRERQCARLLARSVRLDPAGFSTVGLAAFRATPAEFRTRLLGSVLAAVGGAVHAPARLALTRLVKAILDGSIRAGATLGGCRLIPRRNEILVCRELNACEPAAPLKARVTHWDERFMVNLPATRTGGSYEATVRALGIQGIAALRRRGDAATVEAVPAAVRQVLPAIHGLDGLLTVPHLTFQGNGSAEGAGDGQPLVGFRPKRCLADAPFCAPLEAAGVASPHETGV